MLDLARATVGD